MPVHDWPGVNAETFHDFHNSWIIHLKETLNVGLLPDGYYAQSEQHAGTAAADILTLDTAVSGAHGLPHGSGSVAVTERPPRVSRKLVASAASRLARRTLAIRHTSGHRVVALVEIVSPSNKDREKSVAAFAEKACSALAHDCHVLVIDLFPPRAHDPRGMPGAIWEMLEQDTYDVPPEKALSLASFVAVMQPVVYLEHLAVGDSLRDMPLFLHPDVYVEVPLETCYQAAYRGVPAFWRAVVEGREPPLTT